MTRFARHRAALALPAQVSKAAGLPHSNPKGPDQVTSRTRPHHLPHVLGPRRQHRAQALVLGQWATALLGSLALAGTAQAQASQCVTPLHSFAYTGAIETYTVPSTGDYWIEAAGAEGGKATNSYLGPGRGATVGGKFQLTAGTVLRVLVGQQAPLTTSGAYAGWGNGGGGGSFVTLAAASLPNDQPLLVAGGGAGSGQVDNANKHGQAGLAGGAGSANGGAGGTAGSGGAQPSAGSYTSGAGGGFLGDGANNNPITTGHTANGGQAFVNGGAGGTSSNHATGGFGGGGAGVGVTTGGGGGGYSGGGAGLAPQAGGIGGGGGSFNAGADAMAPLVGATDGNPGNGWVKLCMSSAPAPMAITPSPLPQGVAGSAYSATTLAVTGGWSPYSWSASNLPAGMTLSASGELTGTPAAGTAGSYTLTVSDAAQPTPHTATLSFTVLDPVSITSNAQLPDATEGSNYSATLTATGGVAPYTWALVSGSLPPGLTLTPSGEISGTVAKVATQSGASASGQASKAVGTFGFSVVATGGGATPLSSAPQALSLQVVAAAPASPATVTPVPTLGSWALALLGVLTAGLGLRRRVR